MSINRPARKNRYIPEASQPQEAPASDGISEASPEAEASQPQEANPETEALPEALEMLLRALEALPEAERKDSPEIKAVQQALSTFEAEASPEESPEVNDARRAALESGMLVCPMHGIVHAAHEKPEECLPLYAKYKLIAAARKPLPVDVL